MLRVRLTRRMTFGLILALVLFLLLYKPYLADLLLPGGNVAVQPIQMGERTLLIAPHPDDETLGGAGLIQKALAVGKRVKVLIMTNGDGFKGAVEANEHILSPLAADYRRMGEKRRLESLEAMKRLGVRKEDVTFLGYPDGGMNALWESNWDAANLYLARNGAKRSPYDFSFEQEAPYCGENVVKNLTSILHDYRPTDIVYPDPNDQHPDHWATNAFIQYVLTQQRYQAKEWTYLVHRGDFPAPWIYEPNHSLYPPHALTGLDTNWLSLPLSKAEEQKKSEALSAYATQVKVMDPFLDAFIRTNELVGTYDTPGLPAIEEFPDVDALNQFSATFIHDPVGDTIHRELNQDADISAIGGLLSGRHLFIRLDTRGPISKQTAYNLRIRFFHPQNVYRIDMTFQDAALTGRKYASNSLDQPLDSTFQVKGNRLWIFLPDIVTTDTTDLLISADTMINQGQIDKTAWRLVRVK